MDEIKPIIESLLFVSEKPLSPERIKDILPDASLKDIRKVLLLLKEEYSLRKGGFFLCEVAGGHQFRTRPEYSAFIKQLIQRRPIRLSRAALETLSIVAYNQPVIRSEIEQIRGVDSGGTIRLLLERKLIRMIGRKEVPGRPLLYTTTAHFLEAFALKDLKDLPAPSEIDTLSCEETA